MTQRKALSVDIPLSFSTGGYNLQREFLSDVTSFAKQKAIETKSRESFNNITEPKTNSYLV